VKKYTENKQAESSVTVLIFHELKFGSRKNTIVADWSDERKHNETVCGRGSMYLEIGT
jgi:hypothetical protein